MRTRSAAMDPTIGLAVFGGSRAYRQFVREGMEERHTPTIMPWRIGDSLALNDSLKSGRVA